MQSSVAQIFTYIALIEAGVGEASLQAMFKPTANKDRKSVNEILSATTVYYNKIGVIYFFILIGMALLYPLAVKVENANYLTVMLYILFSGALTGFNFFYLAKINLVINAEGDNYIASFLTMFIYLCTSATKIVCIMLGLNIVIIQICYLSVNLIFTAAYYIIVKKKYPWINFHEKPDLPAIGQKNSVLVHKISGIIFQNTDIIILTFFCNLKIVSIYTMYIMIVGMIVSCAAIMSDSVNFVFGQTFNKSEEKDRFCRIIDVFNVYYSSVSFALYTVTFLLILPFLRLYTKGMDYNYIYIYLPYLYILIELLQVGREAMLKTITVAGHFKNTLWRSLLESGINITVSLGAVIFLRRYGFIYGLYGVLLGTITALIYRTIDINIYANRQILRRSPKKSFWIMGTNLLMFLVLSLLSLFDFGISSYLEFAAWGIILTITILLLYLTAQSLLNPEEFTIVKNYIKKRASAKFLIFRRETK